MATNRQQFAFI